MQPPELETSASRPAILSDILSLLPARSWRSTTVWLIIIVNLALIALYFWSRGGATTNVRIEAIGSEYRAFVDGELVAEGTFDGPTQGGIGLRLSRDYLLPALPKPFGIDSVRVTEFGTDTVLFEDDFNGSPSAIWNNDTGAWSVQDGVFTTTGRLPITTSRQDWGDYILEVTLRNMTEAVIYVRLQDLDNAVVLQIGPFRGRGAVLARSEDGISVPGERVGQPRLILDRGQTLQSISAMLLRPYPYALLAIAGAIALAFALRFAWLEARLRAIAGRLSNVAPSIAVGLAAASLVLLWYLLYMVGEAIPHVPDSVGYTFQAKIFASFRFTADAPSVRESFSIFNPHMLQVVDGRWFSHYPFGHPLFLAVGQLFGAIWLVPPVLGAACVALIYAIGKRLYNVSTGLLAAALLFSSPFFLMTASNFMSHNTAAFTILAALFLLTLQTKRRIAAMFAAGVFIGLLFNIRPLTAVAFMPVLGVYMAYELLRAGPNRLALLGEDLAFSAGALLLLGAYFFYNQMTTGDFNTAAYELQGTFNADAVGFSGAHSVTSGIQNQQELLSLLLLVANGWPVAVGLIVAALPFLLGTKNPWDYFLGASFLAIVSAPIVYSSSAVMHGPRYWYEALPFLILLTARGFESIRDAATSAGDWLARRFRSDSTPTPSATISFAVYSIAGLLIAFSVYGWLFGQSETWSGAGVALFTPTNASQLEGFNFTDRRLPDLADEMDLENALIFVDNCPHWWCYGSVFWLNSPTLDGDIVWAEFQGNADDLEVLAIYDDRRLYVANYGFGTIRSARKDEIVRDVEERIAAAAEPAPPTDSRTPAERDQIRREDLETVRTALDLYAQENGEYPNTDGHVQTLCAYETLDIGCNLAATPVDPLGSPIINGYWLRTDGDSYIVIALQEAPLDEPSTCPDDLPNGQNRYCILGTLP